MQEAEVKQLEKDISNLRGECDLMSERVTNLTGGKGQYNSDFTSVRHFRIRVLPRSIAGFC
jgi:hypothetical protein